MYKSSKDINIVVEMVFIIPTLMGYVRFLLLLFIKYYKRGNQWQGDDQALNDVNPEDSKAGEESGDLKRELDNLKNKYEINIKKTQEYKASAEGQQINVTSTTGGGKVPAGYVRYKHMPSDTKTTPTFKLGLVRYNDIPLKFDEDPTGTENVTAVYVYYSQTGDSDHEFPLIVCVDTGKQPWKYYKRGNTWKEEESLSGIDPENPNSPNGGLNTLRQRLEEVKGKFEVKLENQNAYTARPDNTGGTISVGPLTQEDGVTADYRGFKHTIPDAGNKINRITIHGQIVDIEELRNGTIEDKQYVFVYYSAGDTNNTKPLLICLSQSGTTSGNTWYKRQNDTTPGTYRWSNDPTTFSSFHPGNIDVTFAGKLGDIKGELTKGGKTDTGYITLDSIENYQHQ